jgi:hypothetical protein
MKRQLDKQHDLLIKVRDKTYSTVR